MILLAVDIGNTDIKFGIFQDGRLKRQWRAADTRCAPAQFAAMLRKELSGEPADAACEAVSYACVVPDVEPVFLAVVRECLALPDSRIFTVDPRRQGLPVDFAPYPLDQLGMDRLVNACAARLIYPGGPVAVMDFGTATTLDLVSADGRYLGGAITPGLQTFIGSLPQKAARLFSVDLSQHTPETLTLGFDTQSCLEAGLGMGYRGLVSGLLDAANAAYPPDRPPLMIATGGLANSVIRVCGLAARFPEVDPALTLKGLERLYQHSASEAGIPFPIRNSV